MKIAVIMPGYHQIPYEFCRYLAKDDYKVTFILPERNEEMNIMGDGFRIIHLKTLPNLIDLPITPSLYFYLKKENFDIIVSGEDFQPMSFIAAFYASKFNKPFFPIIEKYFLSRFFFLRQLHKFQLKFIAPFIWNTSTRVISHSTAAEKFLIDNNAPKEKVIYLPPGIDTGKFKPIFVNKLLENINILSVARLTYHKGLFGLVDAMKILKDRKYNFKLTIVGDGPLYNPILKKIKMNGLQNDIEIIKWIPYSKMPEFYNKCDVFILNSIIEVVGISVLEAMACGKPVIVTNVGGMPDFVIDGKNGYIVNPNDPNDLAEKMERLSDPSHIQQMGEESLRLVRKKFDWSIVIKDYKKIFETDRVHK